MKITTDKIHGAGNLNTTPFSYLYMGTTVTITGNQSVDKTLTPIYSYAPIKCRFKVIIDKWEGFDNYGGEIYTTDFIDWSEKIATLYSATEGDKVPAYLAASWSIDQKNQITIKYKMWNTPLDGETKFRPSVEIVYAKPIEDIVFTEQEIDFYKQANFKNDVIVQDGTMKISSAIDYQEKISLAAGESYTFPYNCIALRRQKYGTSQGESWSFLPMEMYDQGNTITVSNQMEIYIYLVFKNPEV